MLILPDASVVLLQQPKVANHTFLSAKLDQLIHECVARSTYTDIARKVERYTSAKTSSCQTILKKGRRLTEQTLDSCQLKRIKSLEVQVRKVLSVCESRVRAWREMHIGMHIGSVLFWVRGLMRDSACRWS